MNLVVDLKNLWRRNIEKKLSLIKFFFENSNFDDQLIQINLSKNQKVQFAR